MPANKEAEAAWLNERDKRRYREQCLPFEYASYEYDNTYGTSDSAAFARLIAGKGGKKSYTVKKVHGEKKIIFPISSHQLITPAVAVQAIA